MTAQRSAVGLLASAASSFGFFLLLFFLFALFLLIVTEPYFVLFGDAGELTQNWQIRIGDDAKLLRVFFAVDSKENTVRS